MTDNTEHWMYHLSVTYLNVVRVATTKMPIFDVYYSVFAASITLSCFYACYVTLNKM